MKCRNGADSKLNNKGMTLVELLVAIAILAIIVGPFLHAFISSMRTNAKARDALRTTTVAQDITEGLKAYTVEDLCYQFNYPDKDFRIVHKATVKPDSIEELLYDGTDYSAADPSVKPADPETQAHAGVYSDDGGDTYEYLGQTSGKYYFAMNGISYQKGSYDALISLNAVPYRGGTSKSISPNEAKVISLDKMDVTQDGFFIQDPDFDQKIVDEMNTTAQENANTVSTNTTARTITVTISSEKKLLEKEKIKATISYNYVGGIVGDTTADPIEYDETNVMFNNVETGTSLRNLFLCYYPLYQDWKSDTIVINNPDNVPVNFYLVKQIDSTKPMQIYEELYRMELYLNEDPLTGSIDDSVTNFCTNLNQNLMTKTEVAQVKFYYNGVVTDFDKLKVKNLTNSSERDRLYDISVDIYKEGAAAAGYPADQKLLTFDGSKED